MASEKVWVKFTRFVDVFTPENEPSYNVRFAVLVDGEYRVGFGMLHSAVMNAGAWLQVGKHVLIACRDMEDLRRG